MDTATYRYFVDWNNDGDFGDSNENISAYVLSSSWRSGRRTDVDYDTAGSCSLVLDNSTSIFSSFNSSSPLYGKILPNLRVKVTMQIGAGSEVTMWLGRLESIVPAVNLAPDTSINTAELTAYGILAQFTEGEVDVPLQEDITTGAALGEILDGDSWPAGDRAIDTGQSTLSKWWVKNGSSRLQAMRELQDAEFGRLREGKDGKLVFDGRQAIFTTPHDTPQATYGTGSLNLWNLKQEDSLPGIFNSFRGQVRTFNHSEDVPLVVLADVPNSQGGTPLIIPAGTGSPVVPTALTVWIELPDDSPYISVYDWTTVDYEANTATDGSGNDITAGVSAVKTEYGPRLKIEFSNANLSDAHLIVLRAHGIAVVEGDPIPIRSDDSTSQSKYRNREYPNPSQWLTDPTDAQTEADYIVSTHKDPRPRLIFEVKGNYNAAHLTEVQARENGDRIHVTAGSAFGLYVDEDFIIDSLAHSVDDARVHIMTVLCSLAPAAQLGASGTTYTPKIIPTPGIKVPDDLRAFAIPNGLQIIFGGVADKWNETISEGEFRAKYVPSDTALDYVDLRTASEGGTFAHNGTTQYLVTGLYADWSGCAFVLTSGSAGRWYFAFRLEDDYGWSVWTDGNDTPSRVIDYCDTEDPDMEALGPPASWSLSVAPAPNGEHAIVISASRPQVNGGRIWFVTYQIKDVSSDPFVDVDSDTAPSDILYDGSGEDHTFDPITNKTTRTDASGGGWGTAAVGDLILFDVRNSDIGGWSWDVHHCQWGAVAALNDTELIVQGKWHPPAYQNTSPPTLTDFSKFRIMIVKAPWAWDTGGYFGNPGYLTEEFVYGGKKGDTTTQVFVSPPIPVPAAVALTDVKATVFFDNAYSRSNDDTYSDFVPPPAGSGTDVGYEIILPDAATIAIDAKLSDTIPRKVYFTQLLDSVGSTRVIGNPTGAKHRQPMAHIIKQSSSGGLAWTLGNKYRLAEADTQSGTICGQLPSTDPDAQDYLGYWYDAYSDTFDVVSFKADFGGFGS